MIFPLRKKAITVAIHTLLIGSNTQAASFIEQLGFDNNVLSPTWTIWNEAGGNAGPVSLVSGKVHVGGSSIYSGISREVPTYKGYSLDAITLAYDTTIASGSGTLSTVYSQPMGVPLFAGNSVSASQQTTVWNFGPGVIQFDRTGFNHQVTGMPGLSSNVRISTKFSDSGMQTTVREGLINAAATGPDR